MAKILFFQDTEVSPDITLSEQSTCHEMIWEDGALIDESEYDVSTLEFVCETLSAGKFPDYAVSDLGCPVVSERLKELLEANGIDNIQYFPASVIESAGQLPRFGYYAANILGLFDCIDTGASEFRGRTKDGEVVGIRSMEKLVLKDDESESVVFCRVRLFRRLIVADECLMDVFDRAGIEGVRFVRPERWDGCCGEID